MKVRFNGMYQNVKKGCVPCGHRVIGKRTFIISRTFILPSGIEKSFHIGQEYEVSEVDGNFLLSYSQIDSDGLRQSSFTRVD